MSYVRIFPGERSGNTESVNDNREKKVEGNLRLSFELRTRGFKNSNPFRPNCCADIQYDKLRIHELRRKIQEAVLRKGRGKALARKPQNSGLLVNIEYLVSYPIEQNVSAKKEVRAKLSLYRISQSR